MFFLLDRRAYRHSSVGEYLARGNVDSCINRVASVYWWPYFAIWGVRISRPETCNRYIPAIPGDACQ